MEQRPFVIIGSGPAGAATALFLQQRDPALATEGVVLEKGVHPREKVCAGGLIPHTIDCLERLGIGLRVPHVAVTSAQVCVPGHTVEYGGPDLCWVIRRDEFDHSLVQACQQRRIDVRQATKVVGLHRTDGGVRVETDHEEYQTPLVVGADGSGSLVRRTLVGDRREALGKAMMCDVPVAATRWNGFPQGRYDFDFNAVRGGVRGYSWAFPCLIAGVPHINVGAYSSETKGTAANLRHALDDFLGRIGATPTRMRSFPIRWSDGSGRVSAPNVLLAGDAAGVDPLMGEGISFAFEYGDRAAHAVLRSARDGAEVAEAYQADIDGSWLGRKLRRLGLAERLFYGRTSRVWFEIAARSRVAQDIGIRWYNGVGGLDRHGLRSAAWAWLRGDLDLRRATERN